MTRNKENRKMVSAFCTFEIPNLQRLKGGTGTTEMRITGVCTTYPNGDHEEFTYANPCDRKGLGEPDSFGGGPHCGMAQLSTTI